MEKSESVTKLKKRLIDELEPYFPKLLSYSKYSGANLKELWSENELHFSEKPSSLVVIFESNGSYVGKEALLRLSLYKFIKVYRFSQKNEVYSRLKLYGWPAVAYIGQGDVQQRIDLGSSNIVDTIVNRTMKLAGIER